jgi:hypothetical protein
VGGAATAAAAVGAGAASMAVTQPFEDVRFDHFAKLESTLGDIKPFVETSIENYSHRQFSEPPPAGNHRCGTKMAHLLKNGAMADR